MGIRLRGGRVEGGQLGRISIHIYIYTKKAVGAQLADENV